MAVIAVAPQHNACYPLTDELDKIQHSMIMCCTVAHIPPFSGIRAARFLSKEEEMKQLEEDADELIAEWRATYLKITEIEKEVDNMRQKLGDRR